MLDLTFGEQVKIVLSRKGMTIKELAETIEERTGKKMSRQNLTQRLGRDNFQEQDMRMIAEILECPFHLSILDDDDAERVAQEVEHAAEMIHQEEEKHPEGPVQRFIVAGANHHEELIYSPVRDVTIGELADFGEAMKEQEEQEEQAELEETEAENSEENFAEESAEQMESEELQEAVLEESVSEGEEEESEEVSSTEEVTSEGEEVLEEITQEADTAAQEEVTEDKTEADETEYRVSEEDYAKKKAVTNVFKEYIKKPLLRGYNKAHTEMEREEEQSSEIREEVQAPIQEAAEERKPEPKEEVKGEINPYTGREYETNSVRMHPKRIGYVQVYDRADHKWTDMTEWAFLGYQERKKAMLGKEYEPPIYLD